MKELGEALKLIFEKIAGFFDIFDLSFFVSGAVSFAALLLAGPATNACAQLARRRDLFGIGFVLPKISFDCRLN
jgi:hypothetical protein